MLARTEPNLEPVELARVAAFRIGDLAVHPSTRQLLREGRSATLEPRVMQVLIALWQARGAVVTRDELTFLCWNGLVVSDNAITRVISRLRQVTADLCPGAVEFETITKVGYRAVATDGASPSPAASSLPKSLAVLPFANLTGDRDKDYLGDGMAEELINTLTRSSDLKVPARTSTFSYKGRDVDIRTIARDLGVRTVLEGSVRSAGQRIRVTAQLIEADTGYHLWSQNYDREIQDLLAVQDELADSITATLQVKLGINDARAPDPQTYELNLQARGMAARGTPDGLFRAIELHEQAIARDPDYARASADLAGTLALAVIFGVLPLDRRADARARAEQAIRLDPEYAPPHATVAALDSAAGKWLSAEAGFRHALQRDASEPFIVEAAALHVFSPCGLIRRSLDLTRQAVRLAPAAANQQLNRALLANVAGDRETRDTHFQAAVLLGIPEVRGGVAFLRSAIARQNGRIDEAAEHVGGFFRLLACLMGAGDLDVIGPVYRALDGQGSAKEASVAVREFIRGTDTEDKLWRFPSIVGQMLQWQVMLGLIDDAFDLADRLVASWRRSGHLAYVALAILWGEEMRPFRRDRRFQELVGQLNMFSFWQHHGPPDGYVLQADRLVEHQNERPLSGTHGKRLDGREWR